jgi:choline dehydrogenase-like flavoprotein
VFWLDGSSEASLKQSFVDMAQRLPRGELTADSPAQLSDAAVEADVAVRKETSVPVWHASWTCAIVPRERGGIVDEKLKVYRVQGLRVVDASVFPVVHDTHTVAPTYIVTKMAAAMINQEYGA